MKELGVFGESEGEDEGESEGEGEDEGEGKTNAVLQKMQGCAGKLAYRSKISRYPLLEECRMYEQPRHPL